MLTMTEKLADMLNDAMTSAEPALIAPALKAARVLESLADAELKQVVGARSQDDSGYSDGGGLMAHQTH